MPIYEYRCSQCGTRFERLEWKMNAAAPACPDCGSETHKAISAPGAFLFKGTGSSEAQNRPGGGACCGQVGGCDTPKKCCGQ